MDKHAPTLVGFWHFETARGQALGGEWRDETLYGGSCAFTPDGRMVVFVKTSEYTLGFTGQYRFDGKTMANVILASTNPDLDGKTVYREMTFLKPDHLRLSAVDEVTGLGYELTMKRVHHLAAI